MRKYLYHATDKRNEEKIMNEGLLPGIDGGVYFADSPDNALKFIAFKFEAKEVIVLKVRTRELDPKLMEESFDHSEMFFQCKAWVYMGTVPPETFQDRLEYERR